MTNEVTFSPDQPRWWLVQRYSGVVEADRSIHRQGISRLLSGDYMGSAEFEWGTIPKAWRRMRELAAANMLMRVETPWMTKAGTPVWILAPKWLEAEDLFNAIYEIAIDSKRLKEPAYMAAWMPENDVAGSSWTPMSQRTDAWLLVSENIVVPIFWSVDAKLFDEVYAEINKRIGVDPGDLRMFETRNFEHAGRTISGQVRGIYDHHALLQTSNGQQQNVPYSQIWS